MSVSMKSLGIDQLSVDDRMVLLEEIWDSIAADPESVPLTEEQKQNLTDRLNEFQNNPKPASAGTK